MSLMMSGETSLSAFPDGDNIFQWTGTIAGGNGTVRAHRKQRCATFDRRSSAGSRDTTSTLLLGRCAL